MRTVGIDFETEAIRPRPQYPPTPVGVAIADGTEQRYLAWGHPSGNNCTRAEAVATLRELYQTARCVFHNCAFDIDVGEAHLGLPMPKRYEDTLFLAYLHDPREVDMGLKPLADKYLDMPAHEERELRQWIEQHTRILAGDKWGANICLAPAEVVGKYAIGDVVRTVKLFEKWHPEIVAESMEAAYEVELQVVPVRLHMERKGLYVRQEKLQADYARFSRVAKILDAELRAQLGITPAKAHSYPGGVFNIGSPTQLVRALTESKKVDRFILTDKGNPSTKLSNLRKVCADQALLTHLGMRSTVDKYMSTFMEPWLSKAPLGDGFIHPTFNQVRSTDEHGGRGTMGTTTGRPSSSHPNFNNIPANVEDSPNRETLLALAEFLRQHEGMDFRGMRDYIAPDPGMVFINRDYDQQELRILAHYEDGELMEAYRLNPQLDMHQQTRDDLEARFGIRITRKKVKQTVFAIIYGAGTKALAELLGVSKSEANTIRDKVLDVLPGVRSLSNQIQAQGDAGKSIRTWGRRKYYCEEPKTIKGRRYTFAYKMLNLLIQGGAADITKRAMVQVFHQVGDVRLQVYDEIMCCVPEGGFKGDLRRMAACMEDMPLDVALPTSGGYSGTSWAQIQAEPH